MPFFHSDIGDSRPRLSGRASSTCFKANLGASLRRTAEGGCPHAICVIVTLSRFPRLFRMKIARRSLLTTLVLCLSSFGQDAAMFRGDLAHSGVYKAQGVPKFSQVKWKFHTDGQVISSPAVANGMVFVGSTDGNLYAVDLASGAQKWKLFTGVRVTSSPAVENGVVYFGSYSGRFYAVDAATGKLKWKFQTEGEKRFAGKHLHGSEPAAETMPDPFDFYLSSPALWGGAVYFGSGDGNVYALDAATGALKWKFHTGDVVHASPAIADGTLFIGSWDSYFYALDAASGKEKWRFKTGEDHNIYNQVGIQSSAAVVDGIVYFGCRDSNLYALDARTGEKKWAFNNKGSWVITSPAVRDGKVYFATSDTAHGLCPGCQGRDPDLLSEVRRLAAVLFAGPCRRHALHRFAPGQADRHRSRQPEARVDI